MFCKHILLENVPNQSLRYVNSPPVFMIKKRKLLLAILDTPDNQWFLRIPLRIGLEISTCNLSLCMCSIYSKFEIWGYFNILGEVKYRLLLGEILFFVNDA